MGNLLDENDDTDGSEHPLNDTGREVLAYNSCAYNSEHELGNAPDDHRQQKSFESDFLNAVVNDDRQPGGRTGNPDMAS